MVEQPEIILIDTSGLESFANGMLYVKRALIEAGLKPKIFRGDSVELVEELSEGQKIAAFSSFLQNLDPIIRYADAINNLNPDVFTVLGGPGTMYNCVNQNTIKNENIDALNIGSLTPFVNFAKSIHRGVSGSDYLQAAEDSGLMVNSVFKSLPPVDVQEVELSIFRTGDMTYALIPHTTDCYNFCDYCTIAHFKPSIPVGKIAESLSRRPDVNYVHFSNPNLSEESIEHMNLILNGRKPLATQTYTDSCDFAQGNYERTVSFLASINGYIVDVGINGHDQASAELLGRDLDTLGRSPAQLSEEKEGIRRFLSDSRLRGRKWIKFTTIITPFDQPEQLHSLLGYMKEFADYSVSLDEKVDFEVYPLVPYPNTGIRGRFKGFLSETIDMPKAYNDPLQIAYWDSSKTKDLIGYRFIEHYMAFLGSEPGRLKAGQPGRLQFTLDNFNASLQIASGAAKIDTRGMHFGALLQELYGRMKHSLS